MEMEIDEEEEIKGLDRLPSEVFDKIVSGLYYDDVVSIRQVNRRLKK